MTRAEAGAHFSQDSVDPELQRGFTQRVLYDLLLKKSILRGVHDEFECREGCAEPSSGRHRQGRKPEASGTAVGTAEAVP